MINYFILALISLTLLTGCDLESVSLKLSDIEYQQTDNGFIIKSHNWTDILVNDPQNLVNSLDTYTPDTLLLTNVSNVSLNSNVSKKITAGLKNDTIVLSYE
jgi:hypothetical protein